MLFQPARDNCDGLVAIALKALFFEAVLDDSTRAGAADDLPLVGYVADEFHRFVTSDPLHSEQSYLDTCRSFGAFCLVACQSVASIEHALAHGGGTVELNRSSVAILWNNTATKLLFPLHRSEHGRAGGGSEPIPAGSRARGAGAPMPRSAADQL